MKPRGHQAITQFSRDTSLRWSPSRECSSLGFPPPLARQLANVRCIATCKRFAGCHPPLLQARGECKAAAAAAAFALFSRLPCSDARTSHSNSSPSRRARVRASKSCELNSLYVCLFMLVVGFLLLQKFVRPRSQNSLIRLSTLFAGEVKQKIARDWSITQE
ncbi:hypothetical protein PS2_022904 [Malus domestica]